MTISGTQVDVRTLDDLVTFAHLEVDSGDIEPWAAILAWLHHTGALDDEACAWAVKLYNATDTFGTAFAIMDRAASPAAWLALPEEERDRLGRLPVSGERRNLRGGKLRRHLDDYAGWVALEESDAPQVAWLWRGIAGTGGTFGHPEQRWTPLMSHMRTVWGTGRLSAFEWAEFVGKTGLLAVSAPDACLWESSGPRESLQRIYGIANPTPDLLDLLAHDARDYLRSRGVDLPWWDFETVICDFNVMRKGRYYPGRHLGMIREELEGAPPGWRALLLEAWDHVIPDPWRRVGPGDRADLRPAYARTGRMLTPFGAAS